MIRGVLLYNTHTARFVHMVAWWELDTVRRETESDGGLAPKHHRSKSGAELDV
jgi:hypothetical protein